MSVIQALGQLIGGAATPEEGIAQAAQGIIGMFKLDPTVKAQLAAQLTLANIDEEKSEFAGEIAALQGQIETNKQEAASTNWFVAGWRPFVGWMCGMSFSWVFFLQPMLAFICAAFHHPVVLPTLDISQMMPVLLGMLGLGGLRTYEKVQDAAGNH